MDISKLTSVRSFSPKHVLATSLFFLLLFPFTSLMAQGAWASGDSYFDVVHESDPWEAEYDPWAEEGPGRSSCAPVLEARVYEHADFRGCSKLLRDCWSVRFSEEYWNDRISSIDIPRGLKVVVYEHADFRGHAMTLRGHWTVRSPCEFWNDRISSIRILPDWN